MKRLLAIIAVATAITLSTGCEQPVLCYRIEQGPNAWLITCRTPDNPIPGQTPFIDTTGLEWPEGTPIP